MLGIPTGTYEVAPADKRRLYGQSAASPAIQGELQPIVLPGACLGFLERSGDGHAPLNFATARQRQHEYPIFIECGV